jgi:hypothetical protein
MALQARRPKQANEEDEQSQALEDDGRGGIRIRSLLGKPVRLSLLFDIYFVRVYKE